MVLFCSYKETVPIGFNYLLLPEPYDVIPGDVIAVYSADGKLGTQTVDTATIKIYIKAEPDINTGKYSFLLVVETLLVPKMVLCDWWGIPVLGE